MKISLHLMSVSSCCCLLRKTFKFIKTMNERHWKKIFHLFGGSGIFSGNKKKQQQQTASPELPFLSSWFLCVIVFLKPRGYISKLISMKSLNLIRDFCRSSFVSWGIRFWTRFNFTAGGNSHSALKLFRKAVDVAVASELLTDTELCKLCS